MSQDRIPRFTRSKRPNFFDDPAVDQLLGIVLGLTQEISVLRDRVDTIERVMDDKGSVSRADIESYVPDAEAQAERAQVRAEYLQRVFRVLRHEAGHYSSSESEQHVGSVEKSLADALT
jgi:hypothetical protein